MLRPVAEVRRGSLVPVHLRAARLAGEDLRELRPDELTTAAVVELRRGKEAVGDDQAQARTLGRVREGGPEGPKPSVRDGAPEGPPSHGPLHRCEVEALDHDLAVGVHQSPRELVDGLPAQVHASSVQLCELGFRSLVALRVRDAPGELSSDLAPLGERRLLVPLEGLAVGGGRSHDNTAQRAGRAARAKGPSSPSDTAGENEHAVRLVGQRAAESETEAGEISPVAHRSASGRSRTGVGREADIDEARSRGDLEKDRTNP